MCFIEQPWRMPIETMALSLAPNHPFSKRNSQHFRQVRQICTPAGRVWTRDTQSAAEPDAPKEMGGEHVHIL